MTVRETESDEQGMHGHSALLRNYVVELFCCCCGQACNAYCLMEARGLTNKRVKVTVPDPRADFTRNGVIEKTAWHMQFTECTKHRVRAHAPVHGHRELW